jgi:hypothetical protein
MVKKPDTPHPAPSARILAEVALLLETSRDRLLSEIKNIPAATHYTPYVERLRAAAAVQPDLEALLAQAPKLAAPLVDSIEALQQIAKDLAAGRERLLEASAGQGAAAGGDVPRPVDTSEIEKVLASLRDIASGAEVSLRAVSEIATPLVDSLSDLSQLTSPLAEKLRGIAEKPAGPSEPAMPRPPEANENAADWAGDILRAVRELRQAVLEKSSPAGEYQQRLWENVRLLQVEIVNLQGALLGPAKRRIPDPPAR